MWMNVTLEMEVVIKFAPTTMVLSCALVVQGILLQKIIQAVMVSKFFLEPLTILFGLRAVHSYTHVTLGHVQCSDLLKRGIPDKLSLPVFICRANYRKFHTCVTCMQQLLVNFNSSPHPLKGQNQQQQKKNTACIKWF